MIVVDASVVATMLVYADERGQKARDVMSRDVEWAAPEHWKVEVFSVLRGLVLGSKISEAHGARAVGRLPRWPRSTRRGGRAGCWVGSAGWSAPRIRSRRRTCGGWPGTGIRAMTCRGWRRRYRSRSPSRHR
jgi:hypothetical protein